MAIENAWNYIPTNTHDIRQAFRRVRGAFRGIGDTLEETQSLFSEDEDLLKAAATDFLKAGVGYLANRGPSEQIRDLGTILWWEIDRGEAVPWLVGDMREALEYLQMPPELIEKNEDIDGPLMITGTSLGADETATILFPTKFLVDMVHKPVHSLTMTVALASQIRDLLNFRINIDPQNIPHRTAAFQAHFLRGIMATQPTVAIPQDFSYTISTYGEQDLVRLNYLGGVPGAN